MSVVLLSVRGVRQIAAEVSGASPAELVEVVAACASELASRPVPESAVACMELAERLGRAIDVGEAALAGLVRRVDCSGEAQRSGYSCMSAWLRDRLGHRQTCTAVLLPQPMGRTTPRPSEGTPRRPRTPPPAAPAPMGTPPKRRQRRRRPTPRPMTPHPGTRPGRFDDTGQVSAANQADRHE
jgi:hypothetical protein